MNILAVTCYTGPEQLCKITEEMFAGLAECVSDGWTVHFSATGQGAAREIRECTSFFKENHSFARGMNTAIRLGMHDKVDYILILNNDLTFPKKDWLAQLVKAAKGHQAVFVPATNRAAIRTQTGPLGAGPIAVDEMSAYCWMVPAKWSTHLMKTYGFEMFCEEFVPAYGEDNWTAYLLAKEYGPRVFRYVRRSWVNHLRRQTSRHVPHNRKTTSKILKKKFQHELTHMNLRGDLRAWAMRMVRALN